MEWTAKNKWCENIHIRNAFNNTKLCVYLQSVFFIIIMCVPSRVSLSKYKYNVQRFCIIFTSYQDNHQIQNIYPLKWTENIINPYVRMWNGNSCVNVNVKNKTEVLCILDVVCLICCLFFIFYLFLVWSSFSSFPFLMWCVWCYMDVKITG